MVDQHQDVLLSVASLRYQYGERMAVDQLSFHVGCGEVFGLLGPNGAGKSTTIKCIAGLRDDWQGSMQFSGEPFFPARNQAMRRRLGFVPQELAIYEGLSARENLSLFAKLSGLSGAAMRDAVERSLVLAGLESRANDVAGKFSGGMKRRLNLAVGQVHKPELLLLDEPTVGVDPQSRNHIFEALVQLKGAGMTILYTTHYMEEAERMCDRIAVMNAGKISATGTVKELAQHIGDENADLETVFLQLTGRSLRDFD